MLLTAVVFGVTLTEENPFTGNVLYLFDACMSRSPLLVFLPFIATLPCGYRFIDEYNSNYFRFSLSRSSYVRYALTKAVTAMLTSFAAVFAGLWMVVLAMAVLSRPMDFSDLAFSQLFETLMEARAYGELISVNVYLYILVSTFFISAFACIWPIVGMISSTYFKNRYVSVVMPFMVFFLNWQLSVKVVYLVPVLARFFTVINVYYGCFGLFDDPIISACVTVGAVLLYQAAMVLWLVRRLKRCS